MKVFVTGATGFIGSAVVRELIGAGHQVLGLARSEEGAKSLVAAGAQVHRGDIDDLESLRQAAAMSDGVIHLAFNHDFSKFAANCEDDRRAIEILGSALEGSDAANARDIRNGNGGGGAPRYGGRCLRLRRFRVLSEAAAESLLNRGVRVSVVRLPQVHNTVKQGLVTFAIAVAREKGVSAYVGDGLNRWAAVHVLDAARLYRLAFEKQEAGARYHAVAEEGVPMRDIAEAIGRGLKVPVVSKSPEEAAVHFGWLAAFVGRDLTGFERADPQRLGWHPTGPGLIAGSGTDALSRTLIHAAASAARRT